MSEKDYSCISIEGGLFPSDLLHKVRNLRLPQQDSMSYGLGNLTIRDELMRLYTRLRDQYIQLQPASSPAQTARWIEALLDRALEYRYSPSQAIVILERSFPITHFACHGKLPLVLCPWDQSLDKSSTTYGDGNRRCTPTALVQEYLNAEDNCVWGLVCNGQTLRLLRDNPSLTRPAWVEFDLAKLFGGEEQYADFAVLWLLLHNTRVEPASNNPEDCVLERWRKEAQATGERAQMRLREGVAEALELLGQGFLAHPANQSLLQRLEQGTLSPQAYFQQLLLLAFRLIFLLTTEDRKLLHPPGSAPNSMELYQQGYSMASLRERARKRVRRDDHSDCWTALNLTMRALAQGETRLALPGLGGLFAQGKCPDLENAVISNRYLLQAIHHLSFFRNDQGSALSRVNYKDMDTEEFGSVYENLLELTPSIATETRVFRLRGKGEEASEKGNARKLSGSYYTPHSLVRELVHSALVPQIEGIRKTHAKEPELAVQKLLSLKVVDPSCGSGHFLLAAARQLAQAIAQLQASVDDNTGNAYRHALREVVAHCIYGVDLNPLAIELCKTALWLEAIEPGRPLGFLEAHIRHGNSLAGLWQPLPPHTGIPDDAYAVLTGDDKTVVASLKKQNKEERTILEEKGKQQGNLFSALGLAAPTAQSNTWDAIAEEDLQGVQAKRMAHEAYRASQAYVQGKLFADLYCAAFFVEKNASSRGLVPTSTDLASLVQGQLPAQDRVDAVRQAAEANHFFHWYLEFPEVYGQGGFDVVLGNPPWEMLQFNPQEYYASVVPEVAQARNAYARSQMLEKLKQTNPNIIKSADVEARKVYASQSFIHGSGRFPLTSRGRLNLAPLFAELALNMIGKTGRAGIIVPTGIATDSFTQAFFRYLVTNKRLQSYFGFALFTHCVAFRSK